jgi:hypothetical protein
MPETRCIAFFIDAGEQATPIYDHVVWSEPFYGPYEYGGIDAHGNEWFDLLGEGYELWIQDIISTNPEGLIDYKTVVNEIKSDFAEDGIKVKVKHKYDGKWLRLMLSDWRD